MASDVKRLYRSRDDRWLAGVCGGIAKYFDMDPTIIRVLFILFGFAVGGGLLVYLVLWIVIPEEPETSSAPSQETPMEEETS